VAEVSSAMAGACSAAVKALVGVDVSDATLATCPLTGVRPGSLVCVSRGLMIAARTARAGTATRAAISGRSLKTGAQSSLLRGRDHTRQASHGTPYIQPVARFTLPIIHLCFLFLAKAIIAGSRYRVITQTVRTTYSKGRTSTEHDCQPHCD
jgi:hypothetical protein